LIIPVIIQTIRREPSRPVAIDAPPNLSSPDPSGADQADAEHQATDLAVGFQSRLGGLLVAEVGSARSFQITGCWGVRSEGEGCSGVARVGWLRRSAWLYGRRRFLVGGAAAGQPRRGEASR
jgi:hypothetical protein